MSEIISWLQSPEFRIGLVLVLTGLVFIAFVIERLPADIVAMLAMGVLLVTGVITTNEALSVFANAAPITIAAMFVLSAALERTGVIDSVGRKVVSLATDRGPVQAVVLMMGIVMLLSAFINNTPVVVVLIPVAISLARAVNLPASQMLIPLSFASIFGGTTTLIGTSTNILIDGVSQKAGLAPFGLFEITGAGLILAAIGATYMGTIGRHLLPDRQSLGDLLPGAGNRRFFTQIVIPLDSALIGRSLKEAGFTADASGIRVVDLFRDQVSQRDNLTELRVQAGDRIVLRAPVSELLTLKSESRINLKGDADTHSLFEALESRETELVEGVIGPNSSLIGRSSRHPGLARLYGVYILAVHRRGENVGQLTDNFHLDVGDTLLLEGSIEGLRRMFDEGVLNSLTTVTDRPVRRRKAPIAIAAIIGVVALATLNVLPIAALALIAASLVIALGCLDHQEAYRSVRWDILMLIFGMLSLGIALEKTGAASLIVGSMASLMQGWGPIAILALIYLVTTLMTEVMSNNATAILMTPIAVSFGHQLGIDPRPLVVAVMFAASASFATPIGYQTNTLVYSAGGYRFSDFIKVGLPLNIIMLIASVLVIPLFWPLI